jgi:predicted amidophosphoribosyltransferase
MEKEDSYFCLECGHEQDSLDRECDECGADRVSTYHVWAMRKAANKAYNATEFSTAAAVSHLREAIEHVALELEKIHKSRKAD